MASQHIHGAPAHPYGYHQNGQNGDQPEQHYLDGHQHNVFIPHTPQVPMLGSPLFSNLLVVNLCSDERSEYVIWF